MAQTDASSLASMAASLLERDAEERKALALLLDRYTTIRNKILVQKAEMGGTESYVGAVTLEWFAERVRFASQLPLFKEKLDATTRKVIIDKETIDEILQRPLDYTRKASLAQYLAARRRHKFPPVLVVISQDWVDNGSADEWDSKGQAIRSASEFTPLDSSGSVGLLDVSETMSIFALDGQHRLLGVQGLMELIKTGSLTVLNKDGTPKSSMITVDDLATAYNVRPADLQRLGKELIGIEFISAVVPGETRDSAKRRVRSIFVHVNRMAAPLSLGQIHQLDEDSGFALVAKRAATHHPFLEPSDRVNWESNTIALRSAAFTTLQALTEMARGYLKPKYQNWEPGGEKDLIPMRPGDTELSQGTDDFTAFLNKVVDLPSIKRVAQGTPVGTLRNFSHETANGEGEGNVLFRPVGQMVLATAVGLVAFDQEKPRSLDSVFTKLTAFDKKGGFSHINQSSSIWYGVLYDQKKQRMLVAGRGLAVRLLTYLLNGGIESDEEREALRQEFAQARTLEEKATDLKGKSVYPDDIQLPNPL
jgi:DGQHR domain-containing protein